jgi:hypothetical protein
MTTRRPPRSVPAASVSGARARSHHTLAPSHLGDATAAATLAVIVGGVATLITGLGVVALALTIGSRFGTSAPPNVGSLGVGPVIFGVGLIVLGGALTAGGVAVLANARRARLVTGILAAIAAMLAAAGTVLAMTSSPRDVVIGIALTVATLVFGVAALLLLRPRR